MLSTDPRNLQRHEGQDRGSGGTEGNQAPSRPP